MWSRLPQPPRRDSRLALLRALLEATPAATATLFDPGHGVIEDAGFFRMIRQVFPTALRQHLGPGTARDRRGRTSGKRPRAPGADGHVECFPHSPVDRESHHPDERSQRMRMVGPQQLGRRRVGKRIVADREDAVSRHQSQHAVERIDVVAGCLGERLAALRQLTKRVGDAKVCDDV